MEELLDMIVADESPSQISDKIKDLLFSKSAENIETLKPSVSADVFGFNFDEYEETEE